MYVCFRVLLSLEHAEADTFFCFTNLMSENRDNFIKSLDDSQCGITFKMESVFSKLKEKDTELYMRLVRSRRVFIVVLISSVLWGKDIIMMSLLCVCPIFGI